MKRVYHEANSSCVSGSLSVLGPRNLICNFIFFFLRRGSEITEGSGSAKPSSVPVSPTESYKRIKEGWGSETSRMPGRISLGEFHSLQVTVRATHFSVFCSSAVGTLWICQEFRIPVNQSPCALFSLMDWVFAWSLNLTHFKRIRGLNTAIKIICQVPWSCLCPELLTAQILKTRIGIMTQHSVKSCHDDKMRVELCHQHISKTPHAQKVHWLDCSGPWGPWQKEYLLRKPSSWDSQQQHFLSNHKRWKSQGKRV